jgi:hypothetical protein
MLSEMAGLIFCGRWAIFGLGRFLLSAGRAMRERTRAEDVAVLAVPAVPASLMARASEFLSFYDEAYRIAHEGGSSVYVRELERLRKFLAKAQAHIPTLMGEIDTWLTEARRRDALEAAGTGFYDRFGYWFEGEKAERRRAELAADGF